MTQRLLFSALAWAVLCLPALGQGNAQPPSDEVRHLRAQVADLEERIAALERLAIRFAAQASEVEREAPEVELHGYYAGRIELDEDERVPGADWLRKVPGLVYAKPRTLPHTSEDGAQSANVLSRIAKGKLHPLPPIAYRLGFRFGDRILSVNDVPVDELPSRGRLTNQLRDAPGVAVLIVRKHAQLVLSFRIAPPVHTEPPPPPRATDLVKRFTLVMANMDVEGNRSTVVLRDSASGKTVTLGIGDVFEGFRVLTIGVRGRGESREAEVTLLTKDGQRAIRLTRAR